MSVWCGDITKFCNQYAGKKFDIALIDPPWSYGKDLRSTGCAAHYDVMSVAEMQAIPIDKIMDETSILFIWVTNTMGRVVHDLYEKWGYYWVTEAFVWVKGAMSGGLQKGMGHYTRSCAEKLIMVKRGTGQRHWVEDHGISQVIEYETEAIATYGRLIHSQKPAIFHNLIRSMFGESRTYIELFARVPRKGWLCVGNEVATPPQHSRVFQAVRKKRRHTQTELHTRENDDGLPKPE